MLDQIASTHRRWSGSSMSVLDVYFGRETLSGIQRVNCVGQVDAVIGAGGVFGGGRWNRYGSGGVVGFLLMETCATL
jgi:hypothetical protein